MQVDELEGRAGGARGGCVMEEKGGKEGVMVILFFVHRFSTRKPALLPNISHTHHAAPPGTRRRRAPTPGRSAAAARARGATAHKCGEEATSRWGATRPARYTGGRVETRTRVTAGQSGGGVVGGLAATTPTPKNKTLRYRGRAFLPPRAAVGGQPWPQPRGMCSSCTACGVGGGALARRRGGAEGMWARRSRDGHARLQSRRPSPTHAPPALTGSPLLLPAARGDIFLPLERVRAGANRPERRTNSQRKKRRVWG